MFYEMSTKLSEHSRSKHLAYFEVYQKSIRRLLNSLYNMDCLTNLTKDN
jgi:hypothetical protein